MHYVISTTWGPTDATRASLPFIFAASALEAGNTAMIMLFHDSVTVAVKGSSEQMKPVGPPQRFNEVFAHANAEIIVCKPCAAARGITEDMLTDNCRFGSMNDLHAHASRDGCKIVSF
jgi:sulfur relay (sulfurtransferase) complex TusBCD TusD component (DsrE family)